MKYTDVVKMLYKTAAEPKSNPFVYSDGTPIKQLILDSLKTPATVDTSNVPAQVAVPTQKPAESNSQPQDGYWVNDRTRGVYFVPAATTDSTNAPASKVPTPAPTRSVVKAAPKATPKPAAIPAGSVDRLIKFK